MNAMLVITAFEWNEEKLASESIRNKIIKAFDPIDSAIVFIHLDHKT